MVVEGRFYLAIVLMYVVADLAAFAIFAVIAKNKSRNGYVVGSVGVVLFACLQVWHLAKDFKGLLLSEQLGILYRLVGVPLLLVMLVVGAVGIASRLSKSLSTDFSDGGHGAILLRRHSGFVSGPAFRFDKA